MVSYIQNEVGNPDAEVGNELRRIAGKVRALAPDHRDPERYHVDKSEIEHDLNRLARRLGSTQGRT